MEGIAKTRVVPRYRPGLPMESLHRFLSIYSRGFRKSGLPVSAVGSDGIRKLLDARREGSVL
jgi:hypothetical protein